MQSRNRFVSLDRKVEAVSVACGSGEIVSHGLAKARATGQNRLTAPRNMIQLVVWSANLHLRPSGRAKMRQSAKLDSVV